MTKKGVRYLKKVVSDANLTQKEEEYPPAIDPNVVQDDKGVHEEKGVRYVKKGYLMQILHKRGKQEGVRRGGRDEQKG